MNGMSFAELGFQPSVKNHILVYEFLYRFAQQFNNKAKQYNNRS